METKSLQVSGGEKKAFLWKKIKEKGNRSWDVSETETPVMKWVKEVDLIPV